jgi:hypothetical protein
MIPRELPSDLNTTAELRVHTALAESDLSGVALHSLLLPEHDYKLTAEVDFLLVLEDAIIVVEVKGAGVSCREGLWTYSDRAGHLRTSREGPFQQANSAMYALRRSLEQRLPPRDLRDVPFGYLVITPDVDLPVSVEWADDTYIGRGPFHRSTGLQDSVRRAAQYWSARHHGARPVGRELRQQIVGVLRPEFDRSPGLHVRASLLDRSFDRLTAEQFDRLDLITDNPRVLCFGGAGTGKTFLAADIARRRRRTGAKVLVTCRSPVLAAFLRGRLHATGVRVAAFDDLDRHRAAVDYLVVDEAQDLMSFDRLDVLDRALTGGLEHGDWVMFLDPNGQAHVYDGYEADALQMLRDSGAVPATLRTNCRNTREIAFQTRALTGADNGVAAAGSGPEVQFVTCDDRDQETGRLAAHLRDLRDQGVPACEVTLLSLRGDWATSSARGLREVRRGDVRILSADWAGSWPGDGMTWTSAVEVKGLENRFICVIDVDGLDSDRLDRLYVALSRARAGLWVALDRSAAEWVAQLYTLHSAAALEALKRSGS